MTAEVNGELRGIKFLHPFGFKSIGLHQSLGGRDEQVVHELCSQGAGDSTTLSDESRPFLPEAVRWVNVRHDRV